MSEESFEPLLAEAGGCTGAAGEPRVRGDSYTSARQSIADEADEGSATVAATAEVASEAAQSATAAVAPVPPAVPPAVPPSPAAASGSREYVAPQRTWANVVSKEQEQVAARLLSESPKLTGDEPRARKDTIVDYLVFLAKEVKEGKANGRELPTDLPEELEKFRNHVLMESGVKNISPAKYNRRGMKNDANNCYVNVVIQSLLPCSALMQLLSHCAQSDPERPFYTGMVRLCKEFHSRKPNTEAFNVLQLPQVKEIISTWQSIGAQQDAGEFLFYMLNGLHEECKWKVLPPEPSSSSSCRPRRAGASAGTGPGANKGAAEGAAEVAEEDEEAWNPAREVEVRSAGVHEDSPIVRIFGGVIQSSLRSNGAKADSVSLEPFNHLILDISSESVDSVCSALEAYCRAEAVDEGRATKRLQFKLLPKVLILTLKRFSYNKDTGCPQKIKKAVAYEEKLTFDPSWLVDDVERQEYQLTAVICHHGESANGGHYNAAVRYNSDWYMYDDALVRQMELREVMNQMFTAYLLLYQCHDKVDIRP